MVTPFILNQIITILNKEIFEAIESRLSRVSLSDQSSLITDFIEGKGYIVNGNDIKLEMFDRNLPFVSDVTSDAEQKELITRTTLGSSIDTAKEYLVVDVRFKYEIKK